MESLGRWESVEGMARTWDVRRTEYWRSQRSRTTVRVGEEVIAASRTREVFKAIMEISLLLEASTLFPMNVSDLRRKG
jgi:hypothetical protein